MRKQLLNIGVRPPILSATHEREKRRRERQRAEEQRRREMFESQAVEPKSGGPLASRFKHNKVEGVNDDNE